MAFIDALQTNTTTTNAEDEAEQQLPHRHQVDYIVSDLLQERHASECKSHLIAGCRNFICVQINQSRCLVMMCSRVAIINTKIAVSVMVLRDT